MGSIERKGEEDDSLRFVKRRGKVGICTKRVGECDLNEAPRVPESSTKIARGARKAVSGCDMVWRGCGGRAWACDVSKAVKVVEVGRAVVKECGPIRSRRTYPRRGPGQVRGPGRTGKAPEACIVLWVQNYIGAKEQNC